MKKKTMSSSLILVD